MTYVANIHAQNEFNHQCRFDMIMYFKAKGRSALTFLTYPVVFYSLQFDILNLFYFRDCLFKDQERANLSLSLCR